MFEGVLLYIIRTFVFILGSLPQSISLALVQGLISIIALFASRYHRIALRNLEFAFPDKDSSWRHKVLKDSYRELARVVVDFSRLTRLDKTWVDQHVDCPLLHRYYEVRRQEPGKGVLLVTGHLGSFELLAHCMPVWGHPISFVVRNFKLKKIDAWWCGTREALGNKAIARTGAFQEVSVALREGRDVAVLFDQNVTKQHAVFVPLMGKIAATTKMPALVALRSEAKVFVVSVAALPGDNYRIDAAECDFTSLYQDASMSRDEKILRITERLSLEYGNMIKNNPSAWFWMHRRYRTRPEGEGNPYEGC